MTIQKLHLEQEHILNMKAKRINDLLDIDLKVSFEKHYFKLELPFLSFGTRIGEAHYKVLVNGQFICEDSIAHNPHLYISTLENHVSNPIKKLEHFMPIVTEILYNSIEEASYEELSSEFKHKLNKLKMLWLDNGGILN